MHAALVPVEDGLPDGLDRGCVDATLVERILRAHIGDSAEVGWNVYPPQRVRQPERRSG
jgi:hypothetical protein